MLTIFGEIQTRMPEMTEFAMWIQRELDRRGWSRSEAARRGEISPSAIDKIMGGFANPGIEFCKGISRAFAMPLEDVFRQAAILPPSSTRDPSVASLLTRLNSMDPIYRRDAVNLALGIMDYFERRTATTASSQRDRPSARVMEGKISYETDRADRLAQFRAAFATLTEEERRLFLEELQRPAETETQKDGPAP